MRVLAVVPGAYGLTMSIITDPDERAVTPLVADERDMLVRMLAFQRDTLRWKCSGLTSEQLAFQHRPSELSLGGLLKHLAVVEAVWVPRTFAGVADAPIWISHAGGQTEGWTFRTAADDTPEQLFSWLDEAQQMTERVVAEADTLEAIARESPYGQPCSLRWILLHLVQEYARHLGHADLIREAIDGAVGI